VIRVTEAGRRNGRQCSRPTFVGEFVDCADGLAEGDGGVGGGDEGGESEKGGRMNVVKEVILNL